MLATAHTTTLVGLTAHPVRVEVASTRGPSAFELVGLAEAAVRESRVRVGSALARLGIALGEHRITVNLAPGDLRKHGAGFDLAIAVGVSAALGRISCAALEGTLFLGELSLAGALRPVRGALPHVLGAKELGLERVIVPRANANEVGVVNGIVAQVADDLAQVCDHLRGTAVLPLASARPFDARPASELDMSEVRGQHAARRALEIAAAGGHNVLFVGPPGGGKTMLARRLPSILPPLTFDEAVEVTTIHSVAGVLPAERGLVEMRPFRHPHHTVSDAGLIGGGEPARPGEVSLAHRGVLFLDELPEFRRSALECLREPLETGEVTIARARYRATFPARSIVVAAMNPCPCGYAGDGRDRCGCSSGRIEGYLAKLSGPLLDRIDVHVALPPLDMATMRDAREGECSRAVRARVERARAAQKDRAARRDAVAPLNAELSPRELERVAAPDEAGARLLGAAIDRLGLSARAYGKVLRVARTIADLDGCERVRSAHVAEAVQLRLLDRGYREKAHAVIRAASG